MLLEMKKKQKAAMLNGADENVAMADENVAMNGDSATNGDAPVNGASKMQNGDVEIIL